ncbi:lysophospholipase L1-like esterase [Curtobacterium sp. PhB25]|uniref:SGNH/GDSL hydrolase family protein n=1 Tax=unclassified Curtobacterium TaxID=257496 RepID=UPI0010D2EEE3|nr:MULTISPECIES: SGNH/GDSL hydrolase family protein [unclassified Curtobacterium]TCU84396.1 lysophospholipase L1-like esterase [Curtobacterium sp. PhB191]TDW74562.1 lysophospholipase L1-like esterase [Curtobacterium sp. PhB25]
MVRSVSDRHPWSRYVAIGDSFTEGIGDPDPTVPGGNRGWADRVAEVLAHGSDDFAYANLAIRGRLLQQIIDDQVEPALALRPDLVTVSAGGNDIIRPGSDPDELAERVDAMVSRLRSDGATVVLFTGPDVGMTPVLGMVRGKTAIYNENLHAIALKHGALVADMWALRVLRDPRMWAPDRLHHSPTGHATIAAAVLDALGAPHGLEPFNPEPLEARPWREARAEDLGWAKEYLVPWVVRRIKHTSSGDGVSAKRPELQDVVEHKSDTP